MNLRQVKHTRLKKKSKSKAARFRADLDKFCTLLVHARPNKCQWCGRINTIFHCHHIYHKQSYPMVRHDLLNLVKICAKCHFLIHHGRELDFAEHIKELIDWNYLRELAHQPQQVLNETEYYRRLKELNEAAVTLGVKSR